MLKFAHVVNTVSKEENAELFGVQQVTFNTMVKALEEYTDTAKIAQYAISFSNASDYLPTHFLQLPNLKRDITGFFPANKKRLPFLSDIIQSAYDNIEAEYIVFSNIDIALMPFFYTAVEEYINWGHDALVINRRRIPAELIAQRNLNLLYAEVGKIHTGYDCFVLKRSLIKSFIPTNICIGIPTSGNDLFYNIFTFAEKPKLFAHKHLTFHLGMELLKNWGSAELVKHNQIEFSKLLEKLMPVMNVAKFPGADLPLLQRHYKWLMNPTFSYPHMFKLDMRRGFKQTTAKPSPYKNNSKLEDTVRRVSFDD